MILLQVAKAFAQSQMGQIDMQGWMRDR